jgi:hypothetical protein
MIHLQLSFAFSSAASNSIPAMKRAAFSTTSAHLTL